MHGAHDGNRHASFASLRWLVYLAALLLSGVLLAQVMLQHRDWLMGAFSGVDCAVGYSVDLAHRFVPFKARPALAAYRDRIAARPAFQRCQPKPGDDVIYRHEFYEVPDV